MRTPKNILVVAAVAAAVAPLSMAPGQATAANAARPATWVGVFHRADGAALAD